VCAQTRNLPGIGRVRSPLKPRVPPLTTVQRGGLRVLDEPSMVDLVVWAELLSSWRPWFGRLIMMVKASAVKMRRAGSNWKGHSKWRPASMVVMLPPQWIPLVWVRYHLRPPLNSIKMRNSSKITRSPVTGPWYDTKQKSLVNVSHLIDFHEDEGPVKHPSPPSTQNATQQQASTEQPWHVGRLHLRRLTPLAQTSTITLAMSSAVSAVLFLSFAWCCWCNPWSTATWELDRKRATRLRQSW
jgi:hypothetical protein